MISDIFNSSVVSSNNRFQKITKDDSSEAFTSDSSTSSSHASVSKWSSERVLYQFFSHSQHQVQVFL